MNLSNTAKTKAVEHFLSDYPWVDAQTAYDKVMEDPENLDECIVWDVFDSYSVEAVANWLENLAETVQEAMDEAVKAAKLAE